MGSPPEIVIIEVPSAASLSTRLLITSNGQVMKSDRTHYSNRMPDCTGAWELGEREQHGESKAVPGLENLLLATLA